MILFFLPATVFLPTSIPSTMGPGQVFRSPRFVANFLDDQTDAFEPSPLTHPPIHLSQPKFKDELNFLAFGNYTTQHFSSRCPLHGDCRLQILPAKLIVFLESVSGWKIFAKNWTSSLALLKFSLAWMLVCLRTKPLSHKPPFSSSLNIFMSLLLVEQLPRFSLSLSPSYSHTLTLGHTLSLWVQQPLAVLKWT